MTKKDNEQARMFIERTISILQQYENNLKDGEQSYSHTLFINACVGLLMVTRETILNDLPQSQINKQDWGIEPSDIKHIENNDFSVAKIALEIRNSIAHYNFSFEYNDSKSVPIDKISFRSDFNKIEVEDLDFYSFKRFVLKIADKALKILNEES
ncbi:MAG: hypothetical protein IJB23_07085 [Alistipes sp.]|nr:hypothetical protein [Alistipes sp.]MBQ9962480.1 hypothetical protein [Alistipes sp.]